MVRVTSTPAHRLGVGPRIAVTLLAAFSLLCGIGPSAGAQTAPTLTKGARVRLVIPANSLQSQYDFAGSLLSLRNDTIVLQTVELAHTDTLTVALERSWRLEMLTASRSYGGIGAAIGEGSGILFWRATLQAPWLEAALAAAPAAFVGAFIGAAFDSDTWVPVQTEAVRIAAVPGGMAIKVQF